MPFTIDQGHEQSVFATIFGDRRLDGFYTLLPGFTATRTLYGERKLKKKKKKNCTNGQVCGFSCISKTKTCIANMTTAQLKEHNKAKKIAAGGAAQAPQASATRRSMIRLEKQYKQVLKDISDKYEEVAAISAAENRDAKEKAFDEYQKLKSAKADIVAKMRELQQQGIKTTQQMETEKEEKKTSRMIQSTLKKGEKTAAKYMKGVDPESDLQSAMEKLHSELYAKSKLSREEAQKLADQVEIPTGTSIRGAGYLRGVMADYYQMTGGKGSETLKTLFRDPDNPRAYAEKKQKSINVGSHITKSEGKFRETLFHEMGHHTEFNSETTRTVAGAWIKSRATGDIEPLSRLIPGSNYGNDEYAYPDKFIDPYVGKSYSNRDTEVISMGIQHFASPSSMAKLYEMDREHFYLTLGVISE